VTGADSEDLELEPAQTFDSVRPPLETDSASDVQPQDGDVIAGLDIDALNAEGESVQAVDSEDSPLEDDSADEVPPTDENGDAADTQEDSITTDEGQDDSSFNEESSGGWFGSLARMFGIGDDRVVVAEDPVQEAPVKRETCSEEGTPEELLAKWNGSSLSVLSRFKTHGKLIRNPYPYIVVRNALHPCLYQALERSYPSDEDIIELSPLKKSEVKQNMRVDVWAKTALKEETQIPELWRRFVRYHSSPEFYRQVNRILGSHIRQAHKVKPTASVGMRFKDDTDVVLDCQIAINTPVSTRSTVRGPHIDQPNEIYAGLLYFKHPNDTRSTGGDFNVDMCLRKSCHMISKAQRHKYGTGDTQFMPRQVRVAHQVLYRRNTFVMFVNSKHAIHAVTPRSATRFSRRLVNIVAVKRPRTIRRQFTDAISSLVQPNRSSLAFIPQDPSDWNVVNLA